MTEFKALRREDGVQPPREATRWPGEATRSAVERSVGQGHDPSFPAALSQMDAVQRLAQLRKTLAGEADAAEKASAATEAWRQRHSPDPQIAPDPNPLPSRDPSRRRKLRPPPPPSRRSGSARLRLRRGVCSNRSLASPSSPCRLRAGAAADADVERRGGRQRPRHHTALADRGRSAGSPGRARRRRGARARRSFVPCRRPARRPFAG